MSIKWNARTRIWATVVGCAAFAAQCVASTADAAPRHRGRVPPGPIYSGVHPYLAPSAIYVAPYRAAPRAVVVVPSPWYIPPPVRVYREPFLYPNAIWGAPTRGPTVFDYPGHMPQGEPTPAAPPGQALPPGASPEGLEPVPAPPALPPPAEPPVEPIQPGPSEASLMPSPLQ